MTDVGVAAGEQRAAGMRQAMADFVLAAHRAYLAQVRLLPPGEQAGMPLLAAGRVTVVAAAASNLHVLATTQPMPVARGPEVELTDRVEADAGGPLDWSLRFFDPVVLPGLGLVDEREGGRPEQVRRLLGIDSVLYHLVVQPGSQLTAHHAAHLGAGLAGSHCTVFRGLATLRDRLPRHERLLDELAGALRAGLPGAAALLAAALAPADPELAERARRVGTGDPPADPAELVGLLLAATGTPR